MARRWVLSLHDPLLFPLVTLIIMDVFLQKMRIKKNRKGQTLKRQFYHDGFKRKKQEYGDCYDRLPVQYFYHGTSLIDRLKANRCELCGKENVKLDMHHVRKLKDLQGKEDWERHMIARKRKTIALCRSCHKKVHYGSID